MWDRKWKRPIADPCQPVEVKQGTRRRLLVFCQHAHLLACLRSSEFKGSRTETELKSYLKSLRSPRTIQ